MGNKTIVGWRFGRKDWAYYHLYRHFSNAMNRKKYEHLENKTGDVNFIFTIHDIDKIDKRTIYRFDSGREVRIGER